MAAQTEVDMWNHILALADLTKGCMAAMDMPMKLMSLEEQLAFQKDHPGAHLVIGDFEIRCLSPEKYHL